MTTPEIQALVVRGWREHALERVPLPTPGPGQALVAPTHAAMCGTDLRLLAGTLHDAEYPVIPGHEWAGIVLAAPDRPELVGARVVGENILPCGACPACVAGQPNLCGSIDEIGFTLPGAFAEAFTIPAANLLPLPDSLSGPEGCLLEPLGVALHAIERAGDSVRGRVVGVLGGGAVGLLVAQLAVAGDASAVSIVEPAESRQAIAAGLGLPAYASLAGWQEELPQTVFDATGVAKVFPDGLLATRPGGTYVLVGYSGEESTSFEPATVMLRELTVHGVLSGHGQLRTALAAVTSGAVRLGPLVSEPVPLAGYREVVDAPAGTAPLRRFFTIPQSMEHFATSQ